MPKNLKSPKYQAFLSIKKRLYHAVTIAIDITLFKCALAFATNVMPEPERP